MACRRHQGDAIRHGLAGIEVLPLYCILRFDILRDCSYEFDGICLTPHKKVDVEEFIDINAKMLEQKRNGELNDCFDPDCSLRLNLFADMKALLPKDIDLSMWKVKDMEWVKDCPVPDGEDFRRIKELF